MKSLKRKIGIILSIAAAGRQSSSTFMSMWHLSVPPINSGRDFSVCSWQPSCVWPLWSRIRCIVESYHGSEALLEMPDCPRAHRSHKCPAIERKENNSIEWSVSSTGWTVHYPCIPVDSSYNFDRFHRRFWSRISLLLCLLNRNPFLCAQLSESVGEKNWRIISDKYDIHLALGRKHNKNNNTPQHTHIVEKTH